MALIFPESRCPICEKLLKDTPYFATSGCAFGREDPLFRFCDAGIHWDCFHNWPERRRFADRYYQNRVDGTRSHQPWLLLAERDDWNVVYRPAERQATLHCRALCGGIPFAKSSFPAPVHELNPSEAELARPFLEEFQAHFPVWAMLVLRFDEAAHEAGVRAYHEQARKKQEQDASARRLALEPYLRECAKMAAALKAGALHCPTCARAHANIRFYDRSPNGKSYFICQLCGHSFRP